MATQTSTVLKTYFNKGDQPTESHFGDLIDSKLNKVSDLQNAGGSMINPAKYSKNNIINTINLIDLCIDHDVKSFIFSSSAAVYGFPQYLPLDENHILNHYQQLQQWTNSGSSSPSQKIPLLGQAQRLTTVMAPAQPRVCGAGNSWRSYQSCECASCWGYLAGRSSPAVCTESCECASCARRHRRS